MSKNKKTELTVVTEDRCKADACKSAQARFTFCDTHYEWFKFGLITKVGAKVSDFDKKYEHFLAHQAPAATIKKAA